MGDAVTEAVPTCTICQCRAVLGDRSPEDYAISALGITVATVARHGPLALAELLRRLCVEHQHSAACCLGSLAESKGQSLTELMMGLGIEVGVEVVVTRPEERPS